MLVGRLLVQLEGLKMSSLREKSRNCLVRQTRSRMTTFEPHRGKMSPVRVIKRLQKQKKAEMIRLKRNLLLTQLMLLSLETRVAGSPSRSTGTTLFLRSPTDRC